MFWQKPGSSHNAGFRKQQGQQANMECRANTEHWQDYTWSSSEVMTQAWTQVLSSDQSPDAALDSLHDAVNHCFHTFFSCHKGSTQISTMETVS
jgi:hypothetical protein